MKLIRIPMVSVLGLVAACSGSPGGEKLDIGDRKTSVLGAKLTDYSGSWDGYAEAYQFGSGSDRVRVVLDGAGNGTVEFGDMPPLGTPTDPHAAFPPYVDEQEEPYGESPLREGFKYTVTGASLEVKRFRFNADQGEVLAGWCAMQTPYEAAGRTPYPPFDYSCAPKFFGLDGLSSGGSCTILEAASGPVTGTADCGWLSRCALYQCVCDSAHCVNNPTTGKASFDSALENEGTDLVGTLVFRGVVPNVGMETVRANVRLTRQP